MLLDKQDLIEYFKNKSVIILGSAPNVIFNKAKFIDSFDIVIRLNNYKFFNECKRVDIYYSYFGRSIKKTKQDIVNDHIEFIICKYPMSNWGKNIDGISGDWAEVYEYRKGYFIVLYYIPTDEDFRDNFNLLNRVPTTGVSCILDVLRFNPKDIYITGFDFFGSGLHNINEIWKQGDGNHNVEGEKILIKKLYESNKIEIDNNMKGVL